MIAKAVTERPPLLAVDETSSEPWQFMKGSGRRVEISVHDPSTFVEQNLERILPDWNLGTIHVVIVLQEAKLSLMQRTAQVGREMDRLREAFIQYGVDVASALRKQGFLADIIDPREGYPLITRKGEIPHSDINAAGKLLGYFIEPGACPNLIHPEWRNAVYPSVLFSSSRIDILTQVLTHKAIQHGWKKQHNRKVMHRMQCR